MAHRLTQESDAHRAQLERMKVQIGALNLERESMVSFVKHLLIDDSIGLAGAGVARNRKSERLSNQGFF